MLENLTISTKIKTRNSLNTEKILLICVIRKLRSGLPNLITPYYE